MSPDLIDRFRWHFVGLISLAIWSLLLWQHGNGGVPSHSFMARDDFPPVSNWWGALLVPLLGVILSAATARRVRGDTNATRTACIAFGGALGYGAVLALSATLGWSGFASFLFFSLPVLAAALPVYRGEYILGFVLGLTYSFGAGLMTVIAAAVALISAVVRLVLWPLVRRKEPHRRAS